VSASANSANPSDFSATERKRRYSSTPSADPDAGGIRFYWDLKGVLLIRVSVAAQIQNKAGSMASGQQV
jgi:hypothetical protein